MVNQYIGKLVFDESWGLGLVTQKIAHDRYRVWWYTAKDGSGDWYGELDRLAIVKFAAANYIKKMP